MFVLGPLLGEEEHQPQYQPQVLDDSDDFMMSAREREKKMMRDLNNGIFDSDLIQLQDVKAPSAGNADWVPDPSMVRTY